MRALTLCLTICDSETPSLCGHHCPACLLTHARGWSSSSLTQCDIKHTSSQWKEHLKNAGGLHGLGVGEGVQVQNPHRSVL